MSDATFGWLLFGGVVATVIGLIWAFRSSSGRSRMPDDDEPVAIATGGEGEIAIMVGKLEQSGIKALARNRYVTPYDNPMYGWELLVRHADHEEARRILNLD
jgi:hypothetical protein